MKSALIVLAVASLLELVIWLPAVWRFRNALAIALMLPLFVSGFYIVLVHPRLWTIVLFLLLVYRLFNLVRLVYGRMHERYLYQVTLRTSVWLMLLQLVTLGLLQFFGAYTESASTRLSVLTCLQLALAMVLCATTLRHIRTTRQPEVGKSYPDRELPTLTVAIPARNETDDLQECLRSLLENDYPKLEILVLDDCSANARTPEIIRSFAHDGVRFVEGSEAGPTWLAKNWGYEKLSEEANGELILFCGVDTRFEADALRTLVSTLLSKNKSMLSILPHNEKPAPWSLLVQPVRYAWELCLPRRIFQRPPVLSTCWMIKRSVLMSAGGFKAVSRSIVPESHFARVSSVHDGYSFLRSNILTSRKSLNDQLATAVRTRYPQLHRRPELAAVLTLVEITGLVGPYAVLATALAMHLLLPALFAALTCVLLGILYALIVDITYGRFQISGLLLAPFAVMSDLVLMNYSMYRYEFSEVVWKGRNVCIPVMHVVPHLPKLQD